MNELKENTLALVEAMERGISLEEARSLYLQTIEPLSEAHSASGRLAIAMTELKEMLFVHPGFSDGMRIRDKRASLAILRDELED